MVENKNHTLAVLLVVSAILVVGVLIGASWQVPYVVKESYTEKEPYEAQEPYQVQETYTDYENLRYRVLEKSYRDYFWTSGCDVWTTIQNTDDVGGYFNVDFNVRTSKGTYTTTSTRHFLTSGASHKFLVSFKGDYKSSDYDVNSPTKEVEKTRTITKYRTVTKYRDVTKTRDATKYCSALDKLLGNC